MSGGAGVEDCKVSVRVEGGCVVACVIRELSTYGVLFVVCVYARGELYRGHSCCVCVGGFGGVVPAGEGEGYVRISYVVLVRVAVWYERGWLVGVCVVVIVELVFCDGAVLICDSALGSKVGRVGWCYSCDWGGVRLCDVVGVGVVVGCVDEGGDALVTDVAVHLVVDVGVAARRWWLTGAGGRGKARVIAAVVRGGVVHLSG
jgi:hypothetical protein